MFFHVFIYFLFYFVNCCFANCPETWSFWNGSCYKVFENANWYDAESHCKINEAHLASIHSHDENLFVANMMNYPEADVCKAEPQGWIGLYTHDEFKTWTWSDGTPTDYLYWYPTQPVRGTGNCIYMHIAPICRGKLGMFANAMQCNGVAKKYICKKESIEVKNDQSKIATVPKLMPKIVEPNYCLEGWSFWNGKCYMVGVNANWHNAETHCKIHHAHLASIHSLEENLFLADLANYPEADVCQAAPQAWVGLYKENNEWKWIDGTPAKYFNWYPNNPDGVPQHLCGYLHIAPICAGKQGKLANGGAPCAQVFSKFICKKDPEKEYDEVAKVAVPKTVNLNSKKENCPDSWLFWNENCYKVYENANWYDAESNCKINEAHLASIHSFDENLFVADLMSYPGADVCKAEPQGWIGLYSTDEFKSWKWTDGTPIDYLYWFPTQPIRGTGDCIYMHIAPICRGKIGTFANGMQCNGVAKKYVCKKKAQDSNKLATTNSVVLSLKWNECLESWSFWNGSCYKVFENENWHNAENRCKIHHAHLASIHSLEENLYVADLANHPEAHVCQATPQGWIGLYDDNGDWKWTDGTPTNYVNWYPKNPGPPNKCGYMHIAPICAGKQGMFANVGAPCEQVYKKFICKMAPNEKKDVAFEENPEEMVVDFETTTLAEIKKDAPQPTKETKKRFCTI